jgi:hypothetical protein
MAKAFDTLSHAFLDKVYKFFNLGPVIRRWLALLGNDRQACISLEGKKSTKYFKLGRGRPQGDNISPNTFNFAVQILIFKIEQDPVIKIIPRESPHINNLQNIFFSKECNRDTEKNESLADDNTAVTILEEASLLRIRDSLTAFGNFSGLECNFDKSNILLTFAPTQDEVRLVDRTGFKLTNSIKLLGVDICSDLNNVDDIFEKILQKIANLVSFWERFKLSQFRGESRLPKLSLCHS